MRLAARGLVVVALVVVAVVGGCGSDGRGAAGSAGRGGSMGGTGAAGSSATAGSGGAGGGTSGAAGNGAAGTTGGGGAGDVSGQAGASAGVGGTGGRGGGAGATADAGSADGPGDAPTCQTIEYAGTRLLADILLVLDASGSMNEDVLNMMCAGGCGASSKWALLTPAITHVVLQTDTTVNWGLKLFASDSLCGVSSTIEVPIGASNAPPIASAISARTDATGGVLNGGSTPTRVAIDRASAYLATLARSNPKYIVLATDGFANCPTAGQTSADDTAGAVSSIALAAQTGVPIFVVGIATDGIFRGGVDVSESLNQMAVAGGRPRQASPAYYPVANASELVTTLTTLVTVATGCVFELGMPPAPGTTPTVTYAAGAAGAVPIPRDTTHSDGYDYTDASMSAIRFYGATCDKIVSGEISTVKVAVGCSSG